MNWFERLCRNTGLAVHGVMHGGQPRSKQELRRTVEEEQVSDTVTLRRTTIEEVEIRRSDEPSKKPAPPEPPEPRDAP
jgi:hypothetical protein